MLHLGNAGSIIKASWAILVLSPLSATALAATGFVKTDTTTEGSWIGAYGAYGYFVSQDANTKVPGYAKVAFSGQSNYTWASFDHCLACLANAREPEQPHRRNMAYLEQLHDRCEPDGRRQSSSCTLRP